MKNSDLQAMIDELGERICILVFDNNVKIYIGYPSSSIKSVNELILKTYGSTDMVGVPKKLGNPKLARLGVTSTSWHPTEFLQEVITLDEGFDMYRIDPLEVG